MNDLTPEEQIAKHYAACLDSVNLINGGKPENTTAEEWTAMLERNKEHLRIMLAKDFMQDQDLAPLNAAIAAGK
jgi:hypothetical protein